ncbi:hypothetical protein ACJMK2_039786, partial [Sinanodonta woodiana]
GNHVCSYIGYKTEQNIISNCLLLATTCSTYVRVTVTLYRCCDGWDAAGGTECKFPLCAGNRNPSACNVNEGYVKYRNGSIVQNSGGTCVAPNLCENCNLGYYPNNGNCRACTMINNCNIPRCAQSSDTTCEYCEGEYTSEYGTYAYTRFLDGGKTCRQACSWREGSRCFPGNCSDTTNSSCKCLDGFTGRDCSQIFHETSILVRYMRLTAGLDRVESPPIGSDRDNQLTSWTNLKPRNTQIHVIMGGNFRKDLNQYVPPKYIVSTKVGITYGKVQLDLYRGGNKLATSYIHECQPGIDNPQPDNFTCEHNFSVSDWEPFQHQDRIQFTAEVTNGGHVVFVNYDKQMQVEKYSLTGVTKRSNFNIVFDYQGPDHCRELASNCSSEPLIVPDVTNTSIVQVSWCGWQDTVSGISKYEIEVFQLILNGDKTQLIHGDKVPGSPGPLDSSISEANISLSNVGAYAVVLIAFDRTGNRKASRRILIFDNISALEIKNDPSKVTSASRETNYRWVTEPRKFVHVEWKNRFSNTVYEENGWLNSVEKLYEIPSVLDDNEGERQIERKKNVHGIVRVEVGYETIYENNIARIPFKSVPDIYNESVDLTEDTVDGKRLVIHVRAYDIMGKFSQDIVNVTIDTSPPVIGNFFLTMENRVNTSVSSLKEFVNLTIDWLAYDIHSGIDYIGWRLYDNYTGNTIVHGFNRLSLQNKSSDKEQYQSNYAQYKPGADGYCTPFDGCYQSHFILKSHMPVMGLEKGSESTDYIFEVEVENKAKLKKVMIIKTVGPFTVDSTSPEFTIFDSRTPTTDKIPDANTRNIALIVSVVLACLAVCIITATIVILRFRKGHKNTRSDGDKNIKIIRLSQLKETDDLSNLQPDTSDGDKNIKIIRISQLKETDGKTFPFAHKKYTSLFHVTN